MKKNTILTNLVVEEIDKKWAAIFRFPEHDRKVVVGWGLLPWMHCDVRVIKKNRNNIIGRVIAIHDMWPLADEANIRCEHYIYPERETDEHRHGCGWCKWQALTYDQQLELKHKIVQRCMEAHRIDQTIESVLPAPEVRWYRNKVEYTFGNYIKWRWEEKKIHSEWSMGFHKQWMFGKIIDVDHCDLVDEKVNDIFAHLKKILVHLPTYDQVRHVGALRYLMMRQWKNTDQVMAVLSVATNWLQEGQWDDLKKILWEDEYLRQHVTTLLVVEHNGLGWVLADNESIRTTLRWAGTIDEELHVDDKVFSFALSPKSFFQTNTTACELLYTTIAESVEFLLSNKKNTETPKSKNNVLVDLYCGTGTIGLIISSLVPAITTLVWVDEVSSSIQNAYQNAEQNSLSIPYHFFAWRTEKVMIAKEGILVFDDEEKKLEVPIEEISVIIVDPPRSGLHASAIETLIDLKKTYPEVTLCYISCNPDTLARDLELLVSVYSIQKIQPIDMFPHTHHIENVVALG